MKISIFGTWYVGLVSWACFAELWHEVMCVDIDEKKIENLKNWIIPIYEPELEEIVKRNYHNGRLHFTTDGKSAINFWSVIFNWVWTPPDSENWNKADLKYVYEVAKTIWENLSEYKLLVNKSTVPVWTGKNCRDIIKKELQKRSKDIDFDVASNPEFLREWNAIFDFFNPDRIILWVQNEKSKLLLEELYKPLSNKTQIIWTDIKSAEIIKYASNAFLATKISFINEIANFAELVWGNISDISKWMWADERIWDKFLEAWIWYWGSCFPKDIKAFIETGKDYGFDFKIISQTEEVNTKQKTIVVDKLLKILKSFPSPLHSEGLPLKKEEIKDDDLLKWKTISIWWLAFKPNTDDIREASSLYVIERLLSLWVKEIHAYDPICIENIKKVFKDEKRLILHSNSYDALENSDWLIILTEWNEFKNPDIKKMKKLMKQNIIIDWRNIWIDKDLEQEWFEYRCVWKTIKKTLNFD